MTPIDKRLVHLIENDEDHAPNVYKTRRTNSTQ